MECVLKNSNSCGICQVSGKDICNIFKIDYLLTKQEAIDRLKLFNYDIEKGLKIMYDNFLIFGEL